MKKFLEDLKRELQKRNLSSQEIDEILADHEEMIQSALAQGLSEEELKTRFGDPVSLASELSEGMKRVEADQAKYDDYKLYKTFMLQSDDLDIQTNLVSEDITFQVTDEDSISIYYKGKADIKDYQISYEKGLFTLSAPKKIGFLFMRSSSDDVDFIIEIPKQALIKNFNIKGVSSDVKVLNLDSKNFTLSSTSGDITLNNVSIETAKWNTVSGDMHVHHAQMDVLTTSQVSGDLFIKHLEVKDHMTISTVSGDIKIEDSSALTCELKSVSGDLIGNEFYPSRLGFKSVSGDVKIRNQSTERKVDVFKSSSLSGEVSIKQAS